VHVAKELHDLPAQRRVRVAVHEREVELAADGEEAHGPAGVLDQAVLRELGDAPVVRTDDGPSRARVALHDGLTRLFCLPLTQPITASPPTSAKPMSEAPPAQLSFEMR